MEKPKKDLTAIGLDILRAARNELYLNFPYLDAALCALRFEPGGTASLATDGVTLHYDGAFLAEKFLRGRAPVDRAYLHVVLHCLLRHLGKKGGCDGALWDVACDAAVESILDKLEKPCLEAGPAPARQRFYAACLREMRVLTAEGIYRRLLRERPSEYELAALSRLFLADDHSLWERNREQDEDWKDRAGRTGTGLETALGGEAVGGDAILEQVRAAVRDDVDYRAFLRRFAAPREVMSVDGDGFDFGYYAYGLRLYGNLPLVELPETREEKRIEDFVIALDTSMSTSGELVRQFLACTWAALRSTSTFTRRVNIRVLQCDNQVRADTVIRDLEELRTCMEHFQLCGGSATDFRPVFEYVEKLRREGAFTSLRGMLYFTDGMGIFPKKRPLWETAFVLLEEPPVPARFPPWAIRLVLGLEGLERAVQETEEERLEEMPE